MSRYCPFKAQECSDALFMHVSTVCAGKEKDSSYNIPDAGARVHVQNTE
jgi:hypothetical protein